MWYRKNNGWFKNYSRQSKVDKGEELQDLIEKTNAEIIVFNNELSASQIKNIEEEVKGDYEWKLKVIIIEEKLILVYRKILLLVKILYIN